MMLDLPSAAVTAIYTTPSTIAEDYQRLLALTGIHDQPRRAILIPRLARRTPFPGAGAPPWQLELVARFLLTTGVTLITAVLPSRRDDRYGYAPIAAALGIDMLRYVPSLDRDTLVIVLTPCRIDAHNRLFGATHGLLDLFHHAGVAQYHPAHAIDALARLRRARASVLALADATTISDGRDATAEYAEVRNLLLASRDPVALDTVIAAQFGLDPRREIPWLCEAHRRGLGIADLHAISLHGDKEALSHRWGLTGVPRCTSLHLLRRTAANTATFASWLRDTGWGRLFRAYQMRYAVAPRSCCRLSLQRQVE